MIHSIRNPKFANGHRVRSLICDMPSPPFCRESRISPPNYSQIKPMSCCRRLDYKVHTSTTDLKLTRQLLKLICPSSSALRNRQLQPIRAHPQAVTQCPHLQAEACIMCPRGAHGRMQTHRGGGGRTPGRGPHRRCRSQNPQADPMRSA